MKMSTLIKGMAVGAAAGTACYLLSKTSDRQKHRMKRHAEQALHAAGCVVDDITSMMK
ncbi:MAG: hypothetical protein IJ265_09720 [Oscillospiraceae bacterium]|nr:hypothetical protein [Oscillospiraceae bacterium]